MTQVPAVDMRSLPLVAALLVLATLPAASALSLSGTLTASAPLDTHVQSQVETHMDVGAPSAPALTIPAVPPFRGFL